MAFSPTTSTHKAFSVIGYRTQRSCHPTGLRNSLEVEELGGPPIFPLTKAISAEETIHMQRTSIAEEGFPRKELFHETRV